VGLKADAESVYAAMAPVDRAIVFTLRYGDTVGVEGEDSTTAAAVSRWPDKLVGFAYLDPRRPDCMARLRESVETLGLKGVKYGPIYNGVPLDDPRLEPVYRYLIERDLPLTLHMGTTYTRLHAAELGRPLHVEALALRHPELKVVMAHMAHPWYEECAIVVRRQPNVYAEISAIYYRRWQFYNVMMAVQEYRVADKIFFGSDFPFSTPAEALAMTRAVNDLTAGTQLPRVADEVIESVIHANPFEHWWRRNPLTDGAGWSAPS
jgi:hypothetical protein